MAGSQTILDAPDQTVRRLQLKRAHGQQLKDSEWDRLGARTGVESQVARTGGIVKQALPGEMGRRGSAGSSIPNDVATAWAKPAPAPAPITPVARVPQASRMATPDATGNYDLGTHDFGNADQRRQNRTVQPSPLAAPGINIAGKSYSATANSTAAPADDEEEDDLPAPTATPGPTPSPTRTPARPVANIAPTPVGTPPASLAFTPPAPLGSIRDMIDAPIIPATRGVLGQPAKQRTAPTVTPPTVTPPTVTPPVPAVTPRPLGTSNYFAPQPQPARTPVSSVLQRPARELGDRAGAAIGRALTMPKPGTYPSGRPAPIPNKPLPAGPAISVPRPPRNPFDSSNGQLTPGYDSGSPRHPRRLLSQYA